MVKFDAGAFYPSIPLKECPKIIKEKIKVNNGLQKTTKLSIGNI